MGGEKRKIPVVVNREGDKRLKFGDRLLKSKTKEIRGMLSKFAELSEIEEGEIFLNDFSYAEFELVPDFLQLNASGFLEELDLVECWGAFGLENVISEELSGGFFWRGVFVDERESGVNSRSLELSKYDSNGEITQKLYGRIADMPNRTYFGIGVKRDDDWYERRFRLNDAN
ncbi:hypothetical protein KKC08_03285 [Patescibacteria group bacterium]|nr:hypothetical protein [Patescibacteria group bacterium]MCG2702133.1 hypothetical protein [Candidatus Parcubacteria bacterium]MBU4265072.1 hypothetical protein [Patescibacteria group bacterium]MBU4389688.1 hypothetical protein [Patescibacteria group bacterium]MBU4397162.1 hypothetical protein [Patescibacteria group bacterium]